MRNILVGAAFFITLVGCVGGGGSAPKLGSGVADVEVGECEGNARRTAVADTGGYGASPEVRVTAEANGAVQVYLDDFSANCCPSPSATFTESGSTLTLEFVDVTDDTSCDCACVTDFTVTSEPLSAGDYTVEVYYNGESFGEYDVTVK